MFMNVLKAIDFRKLKLNLFIYNFFAFNLKSNKFINHFSRRFLFTSGIPVSYGALWGLKKPLEESNFNASSQDILLAKADTLFEQQNYVEIYNLLCDFKDSNDVEILWRLSRALYKMSKMEEYSKDSKKLVYEAYDLITKALNLQEDHWAIHKWVAILLNSKTSYEGTKIKIKELYNIKKHMLRAIELNPKDATTLYMIGNWCYQVTDLAWYQRKIASAIFGEPPTSNFEEALVYFELAEKTDPNFYSHNLLMLGKTYLKLNRKDDAIKYLKKAADFLAKNDEDLQAKQEATKILNSI